MTVTGLAEAGHQAILVAHEAGELRRRASEGLRFIGFSPRSEFDVHAGWQLARVLRETEPDVVHAHDPMAVSLAAMALQMRTGALAPSARGRFAPRGFPPEAARVLEMEVRPRRRLHRSVGDHPVDPRRRRHAAGSDRGRARRRERRRRSTSSRSSTRTQRSGCPKGAPLVGNVAALAAHKGQRHLVAAAAKVVRELPDTRFLDRRRGRAARAARAADPRPRPRSARRARRIPIRRARSR